MKTLIYQVSDGAIVEIHDEEQDFNGLATGLKYVKSETATGAETNISQITDGAMGHRIICGHLISGATKTALENATTVEDLKAALNTIFFGN